MPLPHKYMYDTVSPKCQSARGHSNKTKQDLGSTSFPKASSRVSECVWGGGGANNGEAPVTLLHFSLPYQWVGLQGLLSHLKITVGSPGCDNIW